MTKLVAGALVAALCALPGTARADTDSAPGEVVAAAERDTGSPPSDRSEGNPGSDESEYAGREQAAPQLAEFSGGADGIYIGSAALAAILVVLLLVAL